MKINVTTNTDFSATRFARRGFAYSAPRVANGSNGESGAGFKISKLTMFANKI